MLLALDVGNTNVTIGVFKRKEIIEVFRITTKLPRTSDEFGILISNLLKEKGLEENINKSQEQTEKYDKLKILVDNYEINQAENLLFANIDINNIEDLKLALLFYQYVNEKDNEFLEKSNYSREEIEQGIKDISKKYGYENIVNLFFM